MTERKKDKLFQDKGNGEYKNKEFKAAAGKYHRAILYMKVGIGN